MQGRQQPRLAEMIKGQMFDGFLLTRTAAQRTSSNGSKYLDLTLCDISGEVNAKMWDGATPAPNVADVLRVRGMMLEYNGKPQLRVDKMRPATEEDDYDMAQLAPCAPRPAGDMLDYILNRVDVEALLARYEEALRTHFNTEDAAELVRSAKTVKTDAGEGTVLCGDGVYRPANLDGGRYEELVRFTADGEFSPAQYPTRDGRYDIVIQGGGGAGSPGKSTVPAFGGRGGDGVVIVYGLRPL